MVFGSDSDKVFNSLPRIFTELYYMKKGVIKDRVSGSDGDIKRNILPQLIDEIYSVIKREI